MEVERNQKENEKLYRKAMKEQTLLCGRHPSNHTLKRLAKGTSDLTERILIDGHLIYCRYCQTKLASFRGAYDQQWTALPATQDDLDLFPTICNKVKLMAKNREMLEDKIEKIDSKEVPSEILVDLIPQSQWKWSSFWPAKGAITLVAEDPDQSYQLYLGKIQPNQRLPCHRHMKPEQTLILKGTYLSNNQEFRRGDILELREGDTHSPQSGTLETCYCFIRIAKIKPFIFKGKSSWRNIFLKFIN